MTYHSLGFTLALLMCVYSALGNAQEFDHFLTGYSLTGAHASTDCGFCHVGNRFKGTPTSCAQCHNGVLSIGKNTSHIATEAACDDCHVTTSFDLVRFDHWEATQPCATCHNSTIAIGKSPRHIRSTEVCQTCHASTVAWVVNSVDHSAVIGPCSSCHNGVVAVGKSSNHIVTNQECNVCHSTFTWAGARFDHTGVVGTCVSCHNGTVTTGQPADHIPTGSASCSRCHATTGWLPARQPP